mmetsp:Transcript_730/g.1338  ORF Transcript_730/g.1338 Transcript_730/m.1338 type:complete len:115 (-) Transcript_730:152-496(-)
MGGVYREDFAHSRLQVSRFYLVAQENEDPEQLRQKARSLRALGLEPPRAHNFRRFAQRQNELESRRDIQGTRAAASRTATTGGSVSPGAASVEYGAGSNVKHRQDRVSGESEEN